MKKTVILMLLATLFAGQSYGIGLGAWGGYNVASSKAIDCTTYETNGGTCSKGGVAAGADLWLLTPGPLSIGLSAAYVSLYTFKQEYTVSGVAVKKDGNGKMIPVTVGAEVSLLGFVAGGGVGISPFAAVSNVSGVDYGYATLLPTIEAHVGYGFGLGPVSIVPEVRAYYTMEKKTDYTVSGATISVTNEANLNIVPALVVSFKL